MKHLKRGFGLLIVLVFVLSSFVLLTPVLATNACCERDTDGNWCQYTDESNCDDSYLSTYTSCGETSFCQVGCCYSSGDGSCYKNTPQSTCLSEGGFTWSNSADCAIDQCTKGCCTIGDQAFFVTEVKCNSVGAAYEEAAVSFDTSLTTESTCLDSVKNLDFGCCVDSDSSVFETREECSVAATIVGVNFTIEGFHEGMLCSNDLLSSGCAKQQYTGCFEGKVYWYDSCGNRENIYSSDARASYNSGYVLSDSSSCTTNGPYDPSCGNCDYGLGETCGADDKGVMEAGDYTCVDLNCDSTYQNDASPQSGDAKKNGESWCIYDQKVGKGLDSVGSRHYRHLCANGEEFIEPCTDYREQVCVGGILGEDVLANAEALHMDGGDYVEAACRENRADGCSSCNDETLSLTDKYECCAQEDTQDCFWLPTGSGVLEGEIYEDGRCIPQVPKGLKFWSDDGSGADASSDSSCGVASTTCTVGYRLGGWSKLFGGSDTPSDWTVISETPDHCATKDWIVDQNTYCRSLADCGAYYNLVGDPSYTGFSSTMFDEAFFTGVKDIEPFDTSDLGDWDSLKSVEETDEGDKWFSFDSPHFYQNPAFFVATISALAGGISNSLSSSPCGAAVVAKNAVGATSEFDALTGTAVSGAGCLTSGNNADKKCQKGLTCSSGTCVKSGADLVGTASKGSRCAANTGDALVNENVLSQTCKEGLKCLEGKCQSVEPSVDEGDCSISETCSSSDYQCTVTGRGKYCLVQSYTVEQDAQDDTNFYKIDTCGKTTASVGMSCACTSKTQNGFSVLDGYCLSPENNGKYCCKNTSPAAALAPSVPQFAAGDDLSTASSTASGASNAFSTFKSLGSATDTLGCFVGGALPIPTSWIGGATKTGFTTAMNYITLIATVYLVVDYANENQTTIAYTADCNMWQPPHGGDNCEVCNDKNTPCSEYRCRSLGASCALVNVGSDNETCISQYVNDVNSPIISPLTDSLEAERYTITETSDEGSKGYVINEAIPAFTPMTIGVSTDEPAECKYTAEVGIDYDSMSNDFGSNIYLYNHTGSFTLGSEVVSKAVLGASQGTYTIYVRCSDANGNANERDYFIRFTVDTTPDLTPAEILYTSITNGAYMPYGASETAFSVYTNEPAQCRWNVNDTDYSLMAHDMDCARSGFDQSSQYYGTYQCDSTLTDVAVSELNYFYFKCEDMFGNANEDSYKFTLKQTENPLEITEILPSGELYDSDVTLSLKTEGGAENGNAICGFSLADDTYFSMASFFVTNSSKHSQDLTLPEGDYSYYFGCQDIAGNQVYNSTRFTVSVDSSAPVIRSLYIDTIYQVVSLTMDEDSSCEYAPEDFTYGEGSAMSGVNTTVLEANLDSATYAYYVKCRDLHTNEGAYYIDLSAWV